MSVSKKKTDTKAPIQAKSYKTIRGKITRKSIRKFDIDRVSKILDILPKFVKFYNKLSPLQIIALKFYKGIGSQFQSKILSDDATSKTREISFPFYYIHDRSLRSDITEFASQYMPMSLSLDIKDIEKYVETSYKTRFSLLNVLNNIYDMPDCPKLTGIEILFRGMQYTPQIKKLKVGDTYTFKNFISTTIDRNIAEKYSRGDCIFVLMDMKNIPFIYMPNSKDYPYDINKSFSQFMMDRNIYYDFSEYTLPRNLEFKIVKIEKQSLIAQDSIFDSYSEYASTFKKLQKILHTNLNDTTTPDSADSLDNLEKDSKADIIDKALYPQGNVYYCTFTNWHPRTPLNHETFLKDAKYVLDKQAIDTWRRAGISK